MKILRKTAPLSAPPLWAVLERQLIHLMNTTPEWVLSRYTKAEGELKWPPDEARFSDIDGLDDMYESFHNWPLFYLAGGDDKFLQLAQQEFEAITRQAARLDCGHGHSVVEKEYEQGYDWMHQGEGYSLFYFLNLAHPGHALNRKRSLRYAGFYLNEDPDAINFDMEHKHMLCCYCGSKGAAYRNFSEKPWRLEEWKKWYGLPYHDLEGIVTLEDLKDEEKALRMGKAMKERLIQGDTLVNLLSTTLVMNAYLHTGDEKYKQWILDYTNAWRQRTAENGGIVPDNVGPSGKIGEKMVDGHWYGGHYGWTWPHGFYFLAEAMTVATENEALLQNDTAGMDWMREQYTQVESHAVEKDGTLFVPMKYSDPGAIHEYHSGGRFLTMEGRVGDDPFCERLLEKDGWYEFMPLPPQQPVHLWFMTQRQDDLSHIERTHDKRLTDWRQVNDFYGVHKNQGGRDYAWTEYLQGRFPDYPQQILRHNINQVYQRLEKMENDTQDPSTYSDSYLQQRNPITMEGLVELTMGGPLPLYNGGHLMISVRYFDLEKKRPGLPEDVAALVSRIDEEGVCVHLVNLSPNDTRRLAVLSGAFGEHEILSANGEAVGANMLEVQLAPASEMVLNLKLRRFANVPRYIDPFEKEANV